MCYRAFLQTIKCFRVPGNSSEGRGSHTAKPIDDPPVDPQKSGMNLQIFGVRDLLPTWLEFDGIDRMQG